MNAEDWDFEKHMDGHHFDLKLSFPHFEAAKYGLEPGQSRHIVGLAFSKGISRAQSAGEMKCDLGPKCRLQPDRSQFRGCAAAVRRKTCIQDFSQDSGRVSLSSEL